MKRDVRVPLNTLLFHFDVIGHSLPLDQFVNTAISTQKIIDNFNEEFFDKKLKYKLNIIAPSEGGLIEGLEFVVTYGTPLWAFLCTDPGKAYIKGLFGEEPEFWAEKLGSKQKQLFLKLCQEAQNLIKDTSKSKPIDDENYIASIVLKQMALGFVSNTSATLQNKGFLKQKFRSAYSAKNRIFEDCLNNNSVRALGFSLKHDFPIKKENFNEYLVEIPEKETDDEKEWLVGKADISVNSPNWKRDGRKWQARTSDVSDIAFTIEDETFWHHVKIKDIVPDINDTMNVQWVYTKGSTKPTNVRVLRVINYNGKPISSPLSHDRLMEELKRFDLENKDQGELFDQAEDE